MAEHLSASLTRKMVLSSSSLVAVLLLTASCVFAQDIPDPMRPPSAFGQPQADVVPSGPVLQSVLISPTRRIAIISGKTVRVGDKFGDGQVAAISDNEVVLKSGKNRQVLKLFPTLRDLAPADAKDRNRNIPGQPK